MYPFIHIFGRALPTYGLCMATGIVLACYIGFSRAVKEHMDVNSLIILVATSLGCGLFGAKLLYILVTYDLSEFVQILAQGNWDILSRSGQVFYGGLIGGILGGFLGLKLSGTTDTPDKLCKIIVPVIPLAHAIGRIGCFLGGCCYGAPYDGIFSVTFPAVGVHTPVFPVQLLEALLNLLIFGVLLYWSGKEKTRFGLLYRYLILYSIVRFTLEYFRGDAYRGFAQGISTSQWISTALFLCAVALLVLSNRRKKAT